MAKGPNDVPPIYAPVREQNKRPVLLGLLAFSALSLLGWSHVLSKPGTSQVVPIYAQQVLAQCASLNTLPAPPPNFAARERSDRFVEGTRPTVITNATIWTGADRGRHVIHGGAILIDKGIIKHVGDHVPESLVSSRDNTVFRTNAQGAWVTPAINDLHSHLGVDSVPELRGSGDTNSIQGITQPWLRSLDGLDTHDAAYKLSVSGGVATALVLPGSANAIGGQAFVIKLRETKERSPLSMVVEPPYSLLNGTRVDPSIPPRWRYMKHAAGENPSRVYSGTRLDTIWKFRAAYNEARKIKVAQDQYCAKAQAGQWAGLPASIPESLQWEALVDVLRGRVKVNIHIYETVDFTGIVGLSNEFEFPIAAFHHAHEAYLVPDVIKQTYGGAPGVAIFATNARYKRESYRGSEFAAKILHDHGLRVVVKSDHPVLNSRFLLYEAAQAHYYGLDEATAISAVTSTPAELAGLAHRIGYLKAGYDADVVVWDSHPLSLGATPAQVFIDGIAQLDKPFVIAKPSSLLTAPKTPDFEQEAKDAVKYDGLPPLDRTTESKRNGLVRFVNVANVWTKTKAENGKTAVESTFSASHNGKQGVVLVRGGEIVCAGLASSACASQDLDEEMTHIDLRGGSIYPALTSFGSGLGLVDIPPEASTNDGYIFDPIRGSVPSILKDVEVKAADGLIFGQRNSLVAYRAGVTSAITAPTSNGVFGGLSTSFSLGASNRFDKDAIHQEIVALHVAIGHFGRQPSVSSQIAALRKALSGGLSGERGEFFQAAAEGKIPLAVDVVKADHIAILLDLKREIDAKTGKSLRLVLVSASEAHLLAEKIAAASDVSVILIPSRQFPESWDQARVLPGPPLTSESAIGVLLRNNVSLALGVIEEWEARSQFFDAGWAYLEANGTISKEEAISLVSSNVENILGVEPHLDLVAFQGDFVELSGKPVAIISPARSEVDLL